MLLLFTDFTLDHSTQLFVKHRRIENVPYSTVGLRSKRCQSGEVATWEARVANS